MWVDVKTQPLCGRLTFFPRPVFRPKKTAKVELAVRGNSHPRPDRLRGSRENQSLADALWFAMVCAYPVEPYDREWHATLAICVNDRASSQTIRKAFVDPVNFSAQKGPAIDEAT